MAFLDLDDRIDTNGDYIFTSSRQFKAYNLLAHNFIERPEIGINISLYLRSGMSSGQIDQAIFEYLSDFNAQPDLLDISYNNDKGILQIDIRHRREGFA